jgi:hypothetical protein
MNNKCVNTSRTSSDALLSAVSEGIVDDEKSVSSCPSSSSSSSDHPDDAVTTRRFRLKFSLMKSTIGLDLPPLRIIRHKSEDEKSIVVIRRFLSRSRISKLKRLFQTDESVFEIRDRKDDLYHAHRAFRVEVALRLANPKTYRRAVKTSIEVCDQHWGSFRLKSLKKDRILPEFEYIVYDEPIISSRGTYIEPHVDNHSIVTGVVMLSDPDTDFSGGVNCFKGSESEFSKKSFREVKLNQGDLVLFRGEIVTHWITPVTKGIREILQWELSRI